MHPEVKGPDDNGFRFRSKTLRRLAKDIWVPPLFSSPPKVFAPVIDPEDKKLAGILESMEKGLPEKKQAELSPYRDSTLTSFEEEEEEGEGGKWRNRGLSVCTIFEEDSVSHSAGGRSAKSVKRFSEESVPPTPFRSRGWWNVITSPFSSRSSTKLCRSSSSEGEITPEMPILPVAAPMAGSFNYLRDEKDVGDESTPLTADFGGSHRDDACCYNPTQDRTGSRIQNDSQPTVLQHHSPGTSQEAARYSLRSVFSPSEREVPLILEHDQNAMLQSNDPVRSTATQASHLEPRADNTDFSEKFAPTTNNGPLPPADAHAPTLHSAQHPAPPLTRTDTDLTSPLSATPVIEIAALATFLPARRARQQVHNKNSNTVVPPTFAANRSQDAERGPVLSIADAAPPAYTRMPRSHPQHCTRDWEDKDDVHVEAFTTNGHGRRAISDARRRRSGLRLWLSTMAASLFLLLVVVALVVLVPLPRKAS
ncbi:hypothetical protein B0A49_05296 [Cryomyces minteri]|uniref:Uncharacterized protein n=1 Tax=Cryomyces minteri TaxID=331657 RepID=A0A4V5NGJ0_9PEZI|nr:hypothetical protein B0A49_05296 [Cryomyces minteri]